MPDFPDCSLQAVMGPEIAYNWAPYHAGDKRIHPALDLVLDGMDSAR